MLITRTLFFELMIKHFALINSINFVSTLNNSIQTWLFYLPECKTSHVDVSIEKEYFGFTGDKDPEKIDGANNKKKVLEAIGKACGFYAAIAIVNQLLGIFL